MAHRKRVKSSTAEVETIVIPEDDQIQLPETPIEPVRLFWTGCLPTDKEGVEIVMLKENKHDGDPDAFERQRVTSARMWNPKNPNDPEQPRIWIGKCPFFQNLTVTGHEFVAYSETPIPGEAKGARMQWPGSIVAWTDGQLEAVKKSCMEHIIREYTPKGSSRRRGKLLSLNQGTTTREHVNPNVNPLDRPAGVDRITLQRGDTYVAEYVYIVPLDSDVNVHRMDYHTLVPTMNQFFSDPPKPLAVRSKKAEAAIA